MRGGAYGHPSPYALRVLLLPAGGACGCGTNVEEEIDGDIRQRVYDLLQEIPSRGLDAANEIF